MTVDVYFHELDRLPVPECVTPNEDGSYSVFLRRDLPENKKRAYIAHALDHIRTGDFDADLTASQIEGKRH